MEKGTNNLTSYQDVVNTLSAHTHIALDFDDCLFDGFYSRLLTDYIREHHDKTYSIITNRPGHLKGKTIAQAQGLILLREFTHHFAFKHIILSPDNALCGDTVNPVFKGEAAAKIGATVLVDDDQCHEFGCIKYDIKFLHLPVEETPGLKLGLF